MMVQRISRNRGTVALAVRAVDHSASGDLKRAVACDIKIKPNPVKAILACETNICGSVLLISGCRVKKKRRARSDAPYQSCARSARRRNRRQGWTYRLMGDALIERTRTALPTRVSFGVASTGAATDF